jgi:predicted dehydrogenase
VTDEPGLPAYRDALNRTLASELGVPYLEDLDGVLARDDVDIVSMCADVERRGRIGPKCALAGKHLYLDKPLAGSVQDAQAIAEAVEKAGVRSQMFSFITSHWAQAAKQVIEKNQMGKLTGLHADMLQAKGVPGTALEDFARVESGEPERYTFVDAKRELFDMGVYSLGLVLWLKGMRAKTVCGMTGNYFFAEHQARDVEDFGALMLTLEDDTTATATGARIGWASYPLAGLSRIVLTGSEGMRTFSDSTPHLEVYNGEPDFVMPEPHPADPMGFWRSTQQEMRLHPKRRWQLLHSGPSQQEIDVKAFLDCLDRDVEPEMNARAAVHQVEVLMAGYASAARREPVDIPL